MNHFIFALLFVFVFSNVVFAGGPLEVRKGKALSYGKRPIVYRYDKGNLGKLTNTEAISLVEELLSKFTSIKTTSIKFKKDSPSFIDFDVDKNNFKPILQPRTDKDLNGFTPIVFDEDGSIIDSYLGQGAGSISVGIGGPVVLKHGNRFSIPESQIVLNGRFINGIDSGSDKEVSINFFKKTILHEIGHAIGLDHSQLNTEALDTNDKEIRDSTPLMFPKGTNEIVELKQDDISALSLLYPNKTELANFGTIKGEVLRADGMTPVLGANVVLRDISDPLNKSISCVSDFLANKTGSFIFFAVPPGKYTIEIEPIDSRFVSTSSAGPKVGPYTKNSQDKSFQDPVSPGFYTASNDLVTNDKTKATIIDISAGQILEEINIVAALED